jgi:hypothetical protein
MNEMEQRKRRIEILCIIALVVIMMPSADYLTKKAFADLSITIITPTGGGLAGTSDCMDITRGNGIIWHSCDNLIYAIDDTTNTVLANITKTRDPADNVLATVLGTSVIYHDQSVPSLQKFTYSGGSITETGTFTTSSCILNSNTMQYDTLGFIWLTCSSEDKIIRINPDTMTQSFLSQDLTDAVGLECDNPGFVSYSSFGFGVIHCTLTNNYVTFSYIGGDAVIVLLDDIADSSGEDDIMIDGNNDRFIVSRSDGINVFSYDGSGVITLSQSGLGNGAGYGHCHMEPYSNPEIFFACFVDSGTNTQIDIFKSNATQVYQLTNNIVTGFDSSIGIGFDIQDQVFLISSTLNNQRYIQITGYRTVDDNPPPIDDEEEPNIIGGVDCNNPANENKLICRVTDPIGGGGAFVVGNGTSGLTGIMCNIGIVDCSTDTNPRTNGLGLLIFIGSLFVVISMFYLTMGKEAFVIPVYIWIVIILALSAFFTITGLIDPIFLILTVVGIIALAVPQIQKKFFGSGSTMGGGSTA